MVEQRGATTYLREDRGRSWHIDRGKPSARGLRVTLCGKETRWIIRDTAPSRICAKCSRANQRERSNPD